MRRTVINTLSLMVLFSSFVFAANQDRTPTNQAQQAIGEFENKEAMLLNTTKPKVEVPHTNVCPPASSAVFSRTSYSYTFAGCSSFSGSGTVGSELTQDITDSGTISTGTLDFTLTTTSYGSETRINISNGTDSAIINPGASSNETSVAYALDISSYVSSWELAGTWTISVGDSWGDGGGQTACDFTLTLDASSPDLFFSEYIEGSSNNKAIELYNPTSVAIDLSSYQIAQSNNGNGWAYYHTFPTGATIAAGDVWVIANDGVSSTYFDVANADEVLSYPSVVHHNGDDARAIIKISGTDTTFLDIIGDPDSDPGSGWDVAGVSAATANHTLLRNAGTLWGNTDWTSSAGDATSSEWTVYDQNYFDNLGGYPNDPCFDSLTTVTVVALSYGSEKNFMVQNSDGDTLLSCFGCMSSNSTYEGDVCLTDGLYSFLAKDGYGDGWDGATFSITDASGNVLASGTGPSSSDGTSWVEYTFAIGVMLPIVSGLEDVDFAGNILGVAASASMEIINTGMADFTATSIAVSGAAFSSSTTTLTVAPGDTGYINFSYTPTAEVADAGSVVISHNASDDGSSVNDTLGLSGYGVDAVFYESFDPSTGSYTNLPMSGWTITDGNGDATSIPEYKKSWYHDGYGAYGSGNMVAYMGSSNSYSASEQLTSPSFTVTVPSKVSMWVYNYYNIQPLNVIQVSSDGTKDTLGTIVPTQSYALYEFVLIGTGDMQIEFDFTPTSTSWTYMNLDEVSVTELPNTYVSGVVSNSATDAVLAGANVSFGGISGVTDASGGFGLYGASLGTHTLSVSAAGFLGADFTLTVDEGDSLVQNAALVPLDSLAAEVYSSGFETGDDLGWTFTGGTNAFEMSAGFTFIEDYYYYDTVTVAPYAGDSMMVCSPTGYANDEYSWWMNLTNDNMDLSSFAGAEVNFQMNYWTETGYDFIYILANRPEIDGGTYHYVDVNGDGVGSSADALSGSSDGWVEITADLSPFAGQPYAVEVAVLFSADASVDLGFGVAIDDVSVNGFNEPRPSVIDLMAESFVDDQIALTWSDPTGGQRTLATQTITTDRTAIEVDPRNPRKAFEYETGEAEIEYFIPERTDRDLVSYNVYRTDEFLWSDYSDFEFVGNTTAAGYTDASVDNHTLYYYFVSAVYDEGQSAGSNWAAAGAGSVTDHSMADLAIDFEDSTFGMWGVQTDSDNGWGVGDSASAASSYSEVPDNGGYFAYVNDDAVGSGVSSMSRLVSPFFNMGDANQATLSFDYFNESSSQDLLLLAWVGWDTWHSLGSLPPTGGWNRASVNVSFLSGMDHVRLYFQYDDNDAWAYSAAVDNIVVETLDGPTGLTLASTLDDVTLSWTGVGSQAMRVNEYPNPITQEEKEMLNELSGLLSGNELGTIDESRPNTNMSRVQGDSISNPFVVDALPFYASGSTVGFTDDYDEVCPYTGSTSPDVVYELTLAEDSDGLIISLCESYYDTKLYVYVDGDTSNLLGCNDDYCTASHGQAWTSYLEIEDVPAGTYHIVIDGYGGEEGDYELYIEEMQPLADIMYNVYKDGNLLVSELETTDFVDETATLDDACYVVTASLKVLGTDGNAESFVETGPSNEECGALLNLPPSDFTLLSPTDGDTIVIDQSNLGDDQPFAWGASVDPNGTAVEYEVCVTVAAPFDQFCDDNGTSTAQFVPLSDIADYIDSLNQAAGTGVVLTVDWTVYASDGVNETEASDGPRSVTFDAGWVLSVDEEMGIPDVFALHQNYPNPFNPVTTIRFDVPQENHIRMDIYNILGQRVRTLVNSDMQAGYHTIRWNGTNDMGKPLSSGMYIYRIHSSEFTSVKKLVLMK